MVWLIGHKGLLGSDVFNVLQANKIPFFFSDSELDITNASLVKEVLEKQEIKWIVNCAGIADVELAQKEPNIAIAVNSEALNTLIEVAKNKNATIIHISDAEVFDGTKFDGYSETDLTSPINEYSKSKASGDEILINNYDKHIILRTSWLYGKYGINYVHTMLKLYGSCGSASIVDDQTSSPTYTLDVAKVIGYLININAQKYGVYHCSNTGQTDWFEYAKAILDKSLLYEVLPKWIRSKVKITPISSIDYTSPVNRPQNTYLICDKLAQEYNIYMRSWESALDAFFQTIQKKVS